MKSLADRLNLNISSRDQLCVAIAGLCHDIGSWFLYFPVLYVLTFLNLLTFFDYDLQMKFSVAFKVDHLMS